MNAKLLKVALPALMLAAFSAEAKKFEGAHVGADINYKFENQTFNDKDDKRTFAKLKPNGVGLAVNAGYTQMFGSTYLGGDVQVGYGFGKESETKSGTALFRATAHAVTARVEVKQNWNFGFGGLIGMDCMDNCMAFFRLGFDYSQYDICAKVRVAGGGVTAGDKGSKTYGVWYITPGVGMKWKLDQDWAVTGRYDYGHQLGKKTTFGDVKSSKGHYHGLRLGVSYSL